MNSTQILELRVHGVGGAQHARMLGVSSDAHVVVHEQLESGTVVVRRRTTEPDVVYGFSWGELTSGSVRKALWVLLLPLTFTNVAGWGVTGAHQKLQRVLVHVLAGLATLVYTFWIAYIWLDLLALQWRRRVLQLDAVNNNATLRAMTASLWPAVATVLYIALLAAWVKQSHASLPDGQRSATDDSTNREWPNTIDTPDFFGIAGSHRRPLRVHTILVALGGITSVVMFLAGSGEKRTFLNTALLAIAVSQGVVVSALLVIVGWPWLADKFMASGDKDCRKSALSATFPAAAIGAAASHTGFSAAGILLTTRLASWPIVPCATDTFQTGLALAAPTNYLLAITFTVVLIALWFAVIASHTGLIRQRHSRVDDGRSHNTNNATHATVVDQNESDAIAEIGRKGLAVARCLAFGCLIASIGFLIRLQGSPLELGKMPSRIAADRGDPSSFASKLSLTMMALLPLVIFRIIRRTSRPGTKARSIAITWDLLTFWPQRFHPLGVASYGEQAVPDLAESIRTFLSETKLPMIVSAHSQGTVLAVAALHRLAPGERSRVHLVTYGSPLGRLYPEAFPNQFPSLVAGITDANAGAIGSWRNFYRDTDPIGSTISELGEPIGASAAAAEPFTNRRLSDPRPSSDVGGVADVDRIPLEWNRTVQDGIARHSSYLADPELRAYVDALSKRLTPNDPTVQPTP